MNSRVLPDNSLLGYTQANARTLVPLFLTRAVRRGRAHVRPPGTTVAALLPRFETWRSFLIMLQPTATKLCRDVLSVAGSVYILLWWREKARQGFIAFKYSEGAVDETPTLDMLIWWCLSAAATSIQHLSRALSSSRLFRAGTSTNDVEGIAFSSALHQPPKGPRKMAYLFVVGHEVS
ncbi:hypothetical protein BCR44DRAFT_188394 [Catenaria anguillulae PL171]|uniref:Uncharacterized protein n=1 Tax=Catenaria anguillulae PL171 TaxID=765915 RepID=A0A1Y2HZ25_9FUNG|nr:hypothetical protein BCR44DRAFT_188394 [Catenaria anguillulae PL171]